MPATARPTLCFTLRNRSRDWPDLERLSEADIEREPLRFVGGRNSWIAQTFLRLRPFLVQRGFAVRASDDFVTDAICVVHRDDANDFASGGHRSHLVVVRADRPPVYACDHVISQNALGIAQGEHFIPLWPQPGIRRRDAARGNHVERLAYAGRTGSSPDWFFAADFHRSLRRRGVSFDVRHGRWNDYRDVDVAIAVRVAARAMLDVKPATKLYNAWLAGVPMLASPEPAYRELRRSALDFIEVSDARDVLRALDRLRGDPQLYRAMVDNGRERAREFAIDAIRRRWLALIDDVVVPAYTRNREQLGARRLWFVATMTRQKLAAKRFRASNGWELLRLAWSTPGRNDALGAGPISAADVSRIRSRAA